jgi:hypothetical protein
MTVNGPSVSPGNLKGANCPFVIRALSPNNIRNRYLFMAAIFD